MKAQIRLCERFHESPVAGGLAGATAAQLMLVIAALREDPPPAPRKATRSLKSQPRVDRSTLMALARQNHDLVWDVQERTDNR